MLKARAECMVTLEEQQNPVPDSNNIHPSGIYPQGSGVLFLWKVGNQGSELEPQGFSFFSWNLKASLCPAAVNQFVQ